MDSKDRRTKRQKLQDMANQQASPREAEIAQKKLEELKEEPVKIESNHTTTLFVQTANGEWHKVADVKDINFTWHVNVKYDEK